MLCEAFHCTPSQAEREIGQCSPGWLEEILEARQYAEAHYKVTNAKPGAEMEDSPIVKLAQQIRLELAVDKYHAKKKVKADG